MVGSAPYRLNFAGGPVNALQAPELRRAPSRSLSTSQTLDHYKRELLAAQYREAVLLRRIERANTYLQSMGIRIEPDPWSELAITFDGVPVAPGV